MKPFVLKVNDYHDFSFAKKVLAAAGFGNTKHEEVGMSGSQYVGVIFIHKDDETKDLITNTKAKCDGDNDEGEEYEDQYEDPDILGEKI